MFNAIVSKISMSQFGKSIIFLLVVLSIRKSHRDSTPSVMYAFVSFTYLFAMLSSNYALEFVSYPMQVNSSRWNSFVCLRTFVLGFRKVSKTCTSYAFRCFNSQKTLFVKEIPLCFANCYRCSSVYVQRTERNRKSSRRRSDGRDRRVPFGILILMIRELFILEQSALVCFTCF